MNKRILKKVSTPFDQLKPTAAILVVNLYDPQINTIKMFIEAIKNAGLPFFIVGNKRDLVDKKQIEDIKKRLGTDFIQTCMLDGYGAEDVKNKIREMFKPNDKIIILGIFNSGKTSLITKLTGLDLKISDMPGTTLEFTEHKYCADNRKYTLIDTVGQIIDVNKPMMVSIDLSGCEKIEDKIFRIMQEDANGILATMELSISQIKSVVKIIKNQVGKGKKIIVTGAGASALVAMEMAGQGLETGLPIMVFTNNFSELQPISFSKGFGEEEAAIAKYINFSVNSGDIIIGISASGGTGFVYKTLELAKKKGAITVAITENPDTPLGKTADYIIKSNAKPEGPSSSKIQVAHLAIAHALMLTLADERGITADESIKFMMPEYVATKKMGIK